MGFKARKNKPSTVNNTPAPAKVAKPAEVFSKHCQAGEPIEKLAYDKLTYRERKVVDALAQPGRPVLSISDLIDACGWSSSSSKTASLKGRALGNSRVRNQLRRLVRSSWVENAEERGKGTYRLTAKARDRLARVTKDGPARQALGLAAATKAVKRTKRAAPKREAPPVTEAHEAEAF